MCRFHSMLGIDHHLARNENSGIRGGRAVRAFPRDVPPSLQVATLQRLDAGAMYFWMKDLTQEFLKLSIIYSSLEILDKARLGPLPSPWPFACRLCDSMRGAEYPENSVSI